MSFIVTEDKQGLTCFAQLHGIFLKAGVHETSITICVAQGQFRGSVVLAQKIKNLLYHLLTVLPPTPGSSFVHMKFFFVSNSALLFWSYEARRQRNYFEKIPKHRKMFSIGHIML